MSRTEAPKPKLDLTFYPAYCYSASPTWSKWAKLTCWDVHYALRPHQQQGRAYTSASGTNAILFHLNHPIQYVQLVGIVVAIEDYYETHFLVTVDDSSGATVDVVLRKPKQTPKHNAYAATHARSSTRIAPRNAKPTNNDDSDSNSDEDDEQTKETLRLLQHLSTLSLGQPVLAKGTLSLFRATRQLTLLRLQTPPSTTAELQHIASRTAFLNTTLGKPWVLSANKQRKLREAAESDRVKQSGWARRERERRAEQKAWELRREERLKERYEVEEKARIEAAEEARRDGERVMRKREAQREKEMGSKEGEVEVQLEGKEEGKDKGAA